MKRRRLLHALMISTLAGGCTVPDGPSPRTTQPPAGAISANAAFPPIGARWQVRVTESSISRNTAEDQNVTAVSVDFRGRRGYGLAGPTTTSVLDPASFSPIGTIEGGRVAVIITPDSGLFAWPLWVGKSWNANYTYQDLPYGALWAPSSSETRVAAFEDVTVPAGTFKAFRIEFHGGIGSGLMGGMRRLGSPGFETNDTYWYAPDAKMIVKSVIVRTGMHYHWAGRTTIELLSMPR